MTLAPRQSQRASILDTFSADPCDFVRQHSGETGSDFLTIRRAGPEYLVRFARIADYVVNPTTQTVTWNRSIRPRTQRQGSALHLGKNQVLPMLLSTQGLIALHASSVILPNGHAIAFSGPSEIGKSTLARACAKTKRTSRLADDWIAIDSNGPCPVTFAYEESVTERIGRPLTEPEDSERNPRYRFRLCDLAPYRRQAYPLRGIYLLKKNNTTPEIRISRLSARTQYVDLASNLFRLDPTDRSLLASELKLLSSLIATVPIYSLSYPRRRSQLSQVVDQLLQQEQINQKDHGLRDSRLRLNAQ